MFAPQVKVARSLFDIWCTSKSWKSQNRQFFTLLTWSKCASRHNGTHFFDISTSKSGPNPLLVFLTFWLRNVLRATTACTFSTSQLPKVVRPGVFCTFWLRNVLRATTACTFSTSQLPKWSEPDNCVLWHTFSELEVLLEMCFAPQRRAIFISHLPSWLRTRRFSEPTFRPSGATNHWKNTVFRDFPTFSRTWIFFLLTFLFSDRLLLFLIFSLLSDSSHALLFICPYCRKFDF